MAARDRRTSLILRTLALWVAPLATAGAQASIVGTVTDSLTKHALSGAMVQIAADSGSHVRTVTSDSLGAFRFDSVPPGSYIIGFFSPALDSVGIDLLPKRFTVRAGEAHRVDLAIPSARTLVRELCRPSTPNDSLGLLVGHVRDAESRQPRVGKVTLLWFEFAIGQGAIRRERKQVPVETDALGWYAMCGLPTDVGLTASAAAGDEESGFVEVEVPRGGVLVRDFLVSRADSTVTVFDDSTAATRVPVATLRRGSARVAGMIRSDKGKPVTNADVTVPGTGVDTRTQETGGYVLAGLPAGTQSVEVRAFGFEPKRVSVDLRRDSLTTLDVVLDRPVQTLQTVKVYGQGNSAAGLADFTRRMRAGWGRFLTPQQIEQRHAIQVTDLFRTMPGVRVSPTRGFGNAVTLRGGCQPTVYLNGVRMEDSASTDIDMLANPSELTAVEVYTTAGRPAQFWGNNCGSVVLWVGMLPR